MLPPVFFSTASRTEKQSGKGKRTLSISQIETIHKKDNHEFPDKTILGGEGSGGEVRVVLTMKAFTGSISKDCFAVFALSNLTMNVNFLAERKRSNILVAFYLCIRVHLIVSHRKLPT